MYSDPGIDRNAFQDPATTMPGLETTCRILECRVLKRSTLAGPCLCLGTQQLKTKEKQANKKGRKGRNAGSGEGRSQGTGEERQETWIKEEK